MRKLTTCCCAFLGALALFSVTAFATGTATPGQLIISEFRLLGPDSETDEFIEIYNNTDTPHTVTTAEGSAGYAVVSP
jgi:hypothetical protein